MTPMLASTVTARQATFESAFDVLAPASPPDLTPSEVELDEPLTAEAPLSALPFESLAAPALIEPLRLSFR